jgi:hypothetical protein
MLNPLPRTLRKTVYELALPAGRVVGTAGHARARRYLARAVYAEALVRSMGQAKLATDKPMVCNTAKLEIQRLKRSLGPLLPLICKKVGIPRLRGRKELDALAGFLLDTGL